jgi:hypothetical protein
MFWFLRIVAHVSGSVFVFSFKFRCFTAFSSEESAYWFATQLNPRIEFSLNSKEREVLRFQIAPQVHLATKLARGSLPGSRKYQSEVSGEFGFSTLYGVLSLYDSIDVWHGVWNESWGVAEIASPANRVFSPSKKGDSAFQLPQGLLATKISVTPSERLNFSVIGVTSKTPKWASVFKYETEETNAKIQDSKVSLPEMPSKKIQGKAEYSLNSIRLAAVYGAFEQEHWLGGLFEIPLYWERGFVFSEAANVWYRNPSERVSQAVVGVRQELASIGDELRLEYFWNGYSGSSALLRSVGQSPYQESALIVFRTSENVFPNFFPGSFLNKSWGGFVSSQFYFSDNSASVATGTSLAWNDTTELKFELGKTFLAANNLFRSKDSKSLKFGVVSQW